jgi:nitrate reductase NapE component
VVDHPELNAVAREVLLVEYGKAQDSAEHHDGLVWTVQSLNWIGSAVLMGFVLGAAGDPHSVVHKITLLSVATVGVMLSFFVWMWSRQIRAVRNAKYERCKEIERTLGVMAQHSQLRYVGGQTRMVTILTFAFLTAWLVLAVQVAVA